MGPLRSEQVTAGGDIEEEENPCGGNDQAVEDVEEGEEDSTDESSGDDDADRSRQHLAIVNIDDLDAVAAGAGKQRDLTSQCPLLGPPPAALLALTTLTCPGFGARVSAPTMRL